MRAGWVYVAILGAGHRPPLITCASCPSPWWSCGLAYWGAQRAGEKTLQECGDERVQLPWDQDGVHSEDVVFEALHICLDLVRVKVGRAFLAHGADLAPKLAWKEGGCIREVLIDVRYGRIQGRAVQG